MIRSWTLFSFIHRKGIYILSMEWMVIAAIVTMNDWKKEDFYRVHWYPQPEECTDWLLFLAEGEMRKQESARQPSPVHQSSSEL